MSKGKGGGKAPSPNDQRSNVKNPNNPAQKQNVDNRANQINPNNPAHQPGKPASPPADSGQKK